MPIGRPSALVRALILVEKPPRERPSALRSSPLSTGRAMMRADDGCIDHLQSRVTHSASSECLQDHIPQAAVGPPTELTKDRIPVAKFLRQIAPGRAGSHQPKHRVEHAAMIARWSATTPYQERLEIRPLIVGHQSANHRRSPQRAALNQFAIPASIDLSTRPNPDANAGKQHEGREALDEFIVAGGNPS